MKIRSLALLAGSVAFVSACDGLKEALTAHVDVVARAQDHELSVDRLAQLLGTSTLQIPVNRETARIVTDLWTNYELLGTAAAHNGFTASFAFIRGLPRPQARTSPRARSPACRCRGTPSRDRARHTRASRSP